MIIDPDVTVKFASECGLYIDGILKAIGTEDKPIIFTSALISPSGLDWGPIHFSNLSEDAQLDASGNYINGSIIRHAVIEYGGWGAYGAYGALIIESSSPLIERNTFNNNGQLGYGEIVYSIVRIWRNGPSAPYASPVFRNNTLIGNQAGNIITVYLTDGVVIEQNVVADNEGAAIKVYRSTDVTVSQNWIEGNYGGSGSAEATGITFDDSSGIIQFNQIINNCASGPNSAAGYAAIYVGGFSGSVQVLSNKVMGNSKEIYNSSGLEGIVGLRTSACEIFRYNTVIENSVGADKDAIICIGGADAPQIQLIDNNIYNNAALYAFRVTQGSPYYELNASNNYWGTSEESLIDSVIYDFYDDFNLSKVIYDPIATTPIPEAP